MDERGEVATTLRQDVPHETFDRLPSLASDPGSPATIIAAIEKWAIMRGDDVALRIHHEIIRES